MKNGLSLETGFGSQLEPLLFQITKLRDYPITRLQQFIINAGRRRNTPPRTGGSIAQQVPDQRPAIGLEQVRDQPAHGFGARRVQVEAGGIRPGPPALASFHQAVLGSGGRNDAILSGTPATGAGRSIPRHPLEAV